jgi:hypothetical protein
MTTSADLLERSCHAYSDLALLPGVVAAIVVRPPVIHDEAGRVTGTSRLTRTLSRTTWRWRYASGLQARAGESAAVPGQAGAAGHLRAGHRHGRQDRAVACA